MIVSVYQGLGPDHVNVVTQPSTSGKVINCPPTSLLSGGCSQLMLDTCQECRQRPIKSRLRTISGVVWPRFAVLAERVKGWLRYVPGARALEQESQSGFTLM
ncbi:hypothetical protein AAFF_G00285530 [Aldrovandia affinis]|uniref:Uncharacterized protein n=1 Tax=Aldrovandia affinis TaxID=143900 RepID=A0AAD7X163_9TELE|nr:hypothetical protein AAFF_G00285530 [Aldrovandia affinis]